MRALKNYEQEGHDDAPGSESPASEAREHATTGTSRRETARQYDKVFRQPPDMIEQRLGSGMNSGQEV